MARRRRTDLGRVAASNGRSDEATLPSQVAQVAQVAQVTGTRPRPCRAPRPEHLVAPLAGHEHTVAGRFDHWHQRCSRRRPEQPMVAQQPRRQRSEEVEIRPRGDDLPVLDPQLPGHVLLPGRLVRSRVARPPGRDRYRLIEPVPPGHVQQRRQYSRRVPAAREGHDAPATLKQLPGLVEEDVKRVALDLRPLRRLVRPEDDATGYIELRKTQGVGGQGPRPGRR